MLDESSSLADVAFAVCTALHDNGLTAILCGGSAATFYSGGGYQSLDADFVFRADAPGGLVDASLSNLGFSYDRAGYYRHPQSAFTVEFPRGPLAIGRDIVETWTTIERGDQRLYIITVTDCVRDRFLHFWAWNDRSALDAALAVAARNRSAFDLSAFLRWIERERAADQSYEQRRVDEFLRRFEALRRRAEAGRVSCGVRLESGSRDQR
jgi:hypothetical protein